MSPSDPVADQQVVFEPLDRKKHYRGGFSSGVDSVDNFLRKTVGSLQDDDLARCFVASIVDQKGRAEVIGFYALHAHIAMLEGVPSISKKYSMRPTTPIVYLPVMGVNQSRQGKGIGRLLMLDAFKRCVAIGSQIGIAFIALDALNERAAKLYRKMGFQRLPGHVAEVGAIGMCMTMKKVRAAVASDTLSRSHYTVGMQI